ncbi:MAG: hypothetical protein SOZ34_02945 [Clostridia bacterium]|nr:hypothetical protein [Clostridia bacterium]
MLNLDINEQNILSIEPDMEIYMEVHGDTEGYKVYKNKDDSWDLVAINDRNYIYGLSCDNIKELRARLLADYAIGIITKVFF